MCPKHSGVSVQSSLAFFATGKPPLENGSHERPLVPQHAPALVTNTVRGDEVRIHPEEAPVLLVGR